MLRLRSTLLAAALAFAAPLAHAEDENASWTFDTYTPGVCSANGGQHGGCPAGELVRIHVVTVAYGLVRPWHLTFLPGGSDFLVTELPGELRIGLIHRDWPVFVPVGGRTAYTGDLLASSLQTLSFGVIHASHALSLAHDLLFALTAVTCTGAAQSSGGYVDSRGANAPQQSPASAGQYAPEDFLRNPCHVDLATR